MFVLLPFYDTNSPLPWPRSRHLDPPAALALLSTPSRLVPRAAHPHPLSIDLYHPVRGASFLLFPIPWYNLILSEYCSRSPPHCQWKKLTRNKHANFTARVISWTTQVGCFPCTKQCTAVVRTPTFSLLSYFFFIIGFLPLVPRFWINILVEDSLYTSSMALVVRLHPQFSGLAITSRFHRYLTARILNTTKGTSSFQIERLLICGDIAKNPGARFSKVPVTFRARNQIFKSKYKE